MTRNDRLWALTLALIAGVLVACGVYLLTERSLSRILMGVIVLSNGVNVLFLVAAGRAGKPAFVGEANGEERGEQKDGFEDHGALS